VGPVVPATRKPQFEAEFSGVFDVLAATRYRLHQESWQRNEPPRIERLPVGRTHLGSVFGVSA
jgi:hypothetical protein